VIDERRGVTNILWRVTRAVVPHTSPSTERAPSLTPQLFIGIMLFQFMVKEHIFLPVYILSVRWKS